MKNGYSIHQLASSVSTANFPRANCTLTALYLRQKKREESHAFLTVREIHVLTRRAKKNCQKSFRISMGASASTMNDQQISSDNEQISSNNQQISSNQPLNQRMLENQRATIFEYH